jgi:hypothetical protein
MIDQVIAIGADEKVTPDHIIASGTDRSLLLPPGELIDVGQLVDINSRGLESREIDRLAIRRKLHVSASLAVIGGPPADSELHLVRAIIARGIQLRDDVGFIGGGNKRDRHAAFL